MSPPFQYDRFQSPYANSLAALQERGGEIPAQAVMAGGAARARAAELGGQAFGGAVQQIGQTIGAIPQQMRAQKMSDLQMQDIGAQIKERNAIAAQREGASKGLAAVDRIMSTAMKTDPQTGVATFDRKAFEEGLAQSGQGHLYPQYAEMLDKLDASAAKRNASAREMLAQTIYGIAAHGYTPDAVISGAAYLKANHVVTDDHLAPILGAVGADPSPANIKATLDKLTDGMPEYRQLIESEAKRKADLGKTEAETKKATAEAEKLAAEVAGTLPATPAQIETARHNLELERIQRLQVGREAAANAETARHNKATEAANNPLAALTGQPQTASGEPPRVTGDEFLAKLPPNIAGEVKAYAEGRRPFPTGIAMKSPYFQSLIQMVGQYDPTFDAANYNARNKARTDLTSPSGTGGKTINAMNTALQHAGKLSDLIEKLDNYETPLANAVVNPLRSAVGKTAVTNFNAVAPQLMKEIERAWRGAGGSAGEIQDLVKSIGQNFGKQQQREALSQFVDLLKGKLDATQQQRDNIMGPAGASIPVLFDQNKSIMEKIAQRAGGTSGVEQWERGPDGKLHKVGG